MQAAASVECQEVSEIGTLIFLHFPLGCTHLYRCFASDRILEKGTEGKQISICLADVAVVLFSAFTSFNISVAFIYIG